MTSPGIVASPVHPFTSNARNRDTAFAFGLFPAFGSVVLASVSHAFFNEKAFKKNVEWRYRLNLNSRRRKKTFKTTGIQHKHGKMLTC
jgi:hypothetical protein